jgi:3',5'-cyclic AMP phosphodiesterase CpdA
MVPLTGRRALRGGTLLLLAAAVAGCSGSGGPVATPEGTGPTAPPATTSGRPITPEGKVVSGFVAFGDLGGGEGQLPVARAMERWARGHRVDALVITGDNVYERGEPALFDAQLDQPYAALRRTRPMWVTLGNHDVAAGHGATQLRHLGLPDLPYSKQLPGVQLLFVDGNRPDQAQADWLQARLSAPGPRFRVVVFHQPAWSCSNHDSDEEIDRSDEEIDRSDEEIDRRWVPVFERHRVALVLNGNDHNYQRFVSDRDVTYVVTGGGGRTNLYRLDKCPAGTPRRVAQARRNHFTAVEAHSRSLALTAVAPDGGVLDRAVIRR